MRRPYQILLPLLSLFLVRVDLTDLWNLSLTVKMVELLDGDTAVVSSGNRQFRVRFSKIDAAEKGQPFIDGRGDAGRAALECARRIMNKNFYTLIIYKQDIYGRILGELDDLSLRLVQEGCVALYPHAQFSSRTEKWVFVRELRKSQMEGRGLWARGGYLQPKLWRKKGDLRRRRSHRVKS